jgi:hypothetical protein
VQHGQSLDLALANSATKQLQGQSHSMSTQNIL